MVTFKEKSFVIEIYSGTNPIEDWLHTHDEIIDLLQCADPQMTGGKSFYHLLEMLRQMMPCYTTARKMTE